MDVPSISADYVGVDNRLGGRLAMRHLADLGHEHIAFIGGRKGSSSSRARLSSFKAELRRRGISPQQSLITHTDWSIQAGSDAAKSLLTQAHDITAIVCANDSLAIGALGALAEAGLDVPRDISVIGFDDIALASHPLVDLTTVRYPKDDVGHLITRLLVDRIGAPERPPEKHILKPELAVRGTTARTVARKAAAAG